MTFLLPFNNATRLAANYASSSPARLALMTYRRRDSFVTSATRCDATRAVITRRYIQSATLGVTFSSSGSCDRLRTGTFRYRANKNETREKDSDIHQLFNRRFLLLSSRGEKRFRRSQSYPLLVRSPRKLKNVSPRERREDLNEGNYRPDRFRSDN